MIQKVPFNEGKDAYMADDFFKSGMNIYEYRNSLVDLSRYHPLKAEEIEILVKHGNTAESWNAIFVTEKFNPHMVRNCEFSGLVRIGDMEDAFLQYHDLKLSIGIYNSVIHSCDIGDNAAIRNVRYLSHYHIDNEVLLFNIDEMSTTETAKFGTGIIKDGEEEDDRLWIELANETGGRGILPFEKILASDAYLWSKFRGDVALMDRLKDFVDKEHDTKRGHFGMIKSGTIVKNSRTIKDVQIGESCYIKGANKLKNLTILSSNQEETQIGEGVELVNGIIGYGSRIFYGSKAVRFVTGRNVQLKYGARLINSYLGDNSTISCCEVLNNLVFPFHEQHHNNSFLIASTMMGQSNIAADATIGSNHNSRSPDGELVAGRGFWPGLSCNFKHNCKFASFVLVSKGTYEKELNIQFPFTLVSIDPIKKCLQIMPGYWFLYNMYAIARNNTKFKKRDKRKVKEQHIEFDVFAPDTIEEMFYALTTLFAAIGEAIVKKEGKDPDTVDIEELSRLGEKAVTAHSVKEKDLEVYIGGFENTSNPAHILHPVKGAASFRDMIFFYSMGHIIDCLTGNGGKGHVLTGISSFLERLEMDLSPKWWNLGGQVMSDTDLRNIIRDIKDDTITGWDDLHARYNRIWEEYQGKQKLAHAISSLQRLENISLADISDEKWQDYFKRAYSIQVKILELTKISRKKDYTNPFRQMMYENEEEMDAVLGTFKDNSFIAQLEGETEILAGRIEQLGVRL